jgi:hypothetical protein
MGRIMLILEASAETSARFREKLLGEKKRA